jgi:hypothetical protein
LIALLFYRQFVIKFKKLEDFINKKNPKTISLGIYIKNKIYGSQNQKSEIVNPQS